MMDEYITKKQAKQAIFEYIMNQTISKYPSEELCKAARMGAEGAMYEIDYIPAVKVTEIKHACWEIDCDGYYPYCTNCGTEPKGRVMTKYCPECGAVMHKGG